MQLGLSSKTALVTGASAGLGSAVARALAAEGVRLAITARREDALRDLAADMEEKGALPVTVISVDITETAEGNRLAAEARDRLGRVDILPIAPAARARPRWRPMIGFGTKLMSRTSPRSGV